MRVKHTNRIRHRRTRSPLGFTLIETIAAVVILTIAVPPMLVAIHDSHSKRANPILALRARWIAEEKLEDIIADRHSGTRGFDYLIIANYPPESTLTGFPGFSRSVTLTETVADLVTPGQGYMRVRVEVSWTDAQGIARTLGIETILTEYTAS